MNYKRKRIAESLLLNHLEHSSKVGSLKNTFNYNFHNSDKHEDTKYQIFKKLIQQEFIVYTEAKLKSGVIIDILAIKEGRGWIIEVMHSEKLENLEKKKLKYPEDFIIIPVHTKNFQISKFEL